MGTLSGSISVRRRVARPTIHDGGRNGGTHVGRRLVCVTPYVPFAGIDHAGGAFLHAYLTAATRAGWDVHVVAPADPANAAALDRVDESIHVLLHRSRRGLLSR